MEKQKLSRLLEPNLKLCFLCMLLFSAATCAANALLGLAEIVVTIGLYVYFTQQFPASAENLTVY